jgi:hypothetical protein
MHTWCEYHELAPVAQSAAYTCQLKKMRFSRSVRQQAAGRDLLLGCILGRGLLDHGRDHAVVAGVPVGRDLPGLAVPGLDASDARTLVVRARHLDWPQLALEAELLETIGGEVEVLEAPAHLLASERLLAEPLLRRANGLDAEHGVDQSAHVEDLARLLPFRPGRRRRSLQVTNQ